MTRGMKGIGRSSDKHSPGRRVLQRRFGGTVAATFVAIAATMLFALPAGALEPIVIPTDTVVRGTEGDVFVLAEVSTGGDAGCEATVSATSANNPSVHVENDLIVSSGGGSVVISDVESAPGVELSGSGTLMLGDTITVAVQLGPKDELRANSIFSGGVTVTVSCVQVTTTTTQTTTTTTQPTPSTTTLEVTTTTASPPPTVLGTSTTTLPPATTVPPVTGDTLPFTGPGQIVGTAIAGGALLLLGGALVLGTRESHSTD